MKGYQIAEVSSFQGTRKQYPEVISSRMKRMKEMHPGAEIRSFDRTVKAGGAALHLVVLVARRKAVEL